MTKGVRPSRSQAGFSLVEVMITMVVAVVGLLAVASATTSLSLLRKRSAEESAIHSAMVGELERARGELYSNTPFNAAAMSAVAAGNEFSQQVIVDADGDGQQDFSATKSNNWTPILTVTVGPAAGGVPGNFAVQVDVQASWYGIGGQQTRNLGTLVANRWGYGS